MIYLCKRCGYVFEWMGFADDPYESLECVQCGCIMLLKSDEIIEEIVGNNLKYLKATNKIIDYEIQGKPYIEQDTLHIPITVELKKPLDNIKIDMKLVR